MKNTINKSKKIILENLEKIRKDLKEQFEIDYGNEISNKDIKEFLLEKIKELDLSIKIIKDFLLKI